MSETLINPPFYRKALTFFLTPSPARKAVIYAVLGLAVLGTMLYAGTRFMAWRSTKAIDKLKANINAATTELVQVQANINADERDQEVKLENVNKATTEYVTAINATETAKTETNRAITNLHTAVHNKHNVNITVSDLERKLKDIPEE